MNSLDLLVELQGIRRRDPKTTRVMNLLIDMLGEPRVIDAVDDALARFERKGSAA